MSGLEKWVLVTDYLATILSAVQLGWDWYSIVSEWKKAPEVATAAPGSTAPKSERGEIDISGGLGLASNACGLVSLVLQMIADWSKNTAAKNAVLVLDSVSGVATVTSDIAAEGTGTPFALTCGIAGGVAVACQTAALTTFWITSA